MVPTFLLHKVAVLLFVDLCEQVILLFRELAVTFVQFLCKVADFTLLLFQLVLVPAFNTLDQRVVALLPLFSFRLVAVVQVGHGLFEFDVGVVQVQVQFLLEVLEMLNFCVLNDAFPFEHRVEVHLLRVPVFRVTPQVVQLRLQSLTVYISLLLDFV